MKRIPPPLPALLEVVSSSELLLMIKHFMGPHSLPCSLSAVLLRAIYYICWILLCNLGALLLLLIHCMF